MRRYVLFFIAIASFTFSENIYEKGKRCMAEQIENNISEVKAVVGRLLLNQADTPQKRNNLIQDVLKKDDLIDQIVNILSHDFLQKYITDQDVNLQSKLALIHKMLNLCFQVKSTVDMKIVEELETSFKSFAEMLSISKTRSYQYKPYKYRKYKSK